MSELGEQAVREQAVRDVIRLFNLPPALIECWQAFRGEQAIPPGTVLTSADAEPPIGTRVRDDCGVEWVNDGHYPACWVQPDAEIHAPETWAKIAGNYGPVTILGESDR